MVDQAADNKKKRRRRMGVIAGAASIVIMAAGIAWRVIGGGSDMVTGDRHHPFGTLDATELASWNLDAAVSGDASITGDASTTDASP
jgi:hypothetical protein